MEEDEFANDTWTHMLEVSNYQEEYARNKFRTFSTLWYATV